MDACTSTEVLQEILYRYSALRRLDLARDVYEIFVEICPEVLSVTLADTDRAKALLCEVEGIGARDAIHAAVALNHDVRRVASFDSGFVSVPGLERMRLD